MKVISLIIIRMCGNSLWLGKYNQFTAPITVPINALAKMLYDSKNAVTGFVQQDTFISSDSKLDCVGSKTKLFTAQ